MIQHTALALYGNKRGHLIVILYEGDPISPWGPIHQFETINVPGEELSYSFYDLDYGDYVLLLAHDENLNNTYDIDPATQVGTEGMFILNYDKLDTSSGIPDLTFDALKFTFDQPEMAVEGEMLYPPFPGQESE